MKILKKQINDAIRHLEDAQFQMVLSYDNIKVNHAKLALVSLRDEIIDQLGKGNTDSEP